jgi:ABC-type polysaccharide/polyol phosphate export permease
MALVFNALTRFDGGLTAVTYIVTMVLQTVANGPGLTPHGGLPDWLYQLQRVLPPIHALDSVRTQLYRGDAIVMADLWHVVLYSVGLTIVGLFLLRRAPLSR